MRGPETAIPEVAMDQALTDPTLLGAALGDAATWSTWITVLRAAAGLPLNTEQRSVFAQIAGDRAPPDRWVRELWAVVGRGGGKSRMAAACAVHAALLQRHELAAGEVGYVLVLSQTQAQTGVVLQFCLAFIQSSQVLRQQIVSITQSEIRLRNNIVIAVHPNSFRSVRGRTLIACIFDECSFWRDETSALPDVEAYRACLPSLIRAGGTLIGISTGYRKMGLLYGKYRDFFAKNDADVLVVQGESRQFNPTLSEAEISKAAADDPDGAEVEWGLKAFRSDVGAFLSDADVGACCNPDRPLEFPVRSDVKYAAFVDHSGGRGDDAVLCIGWREGDRVIVSTLRAVHPPFDPKVITAEFSALLREHRCTEVTGDNYSAAWIEGEFKANGIRYIRCDLPKGRLYVEGLPAFTRRIVSYPEMPRLLRQLRLLERHVGIGKDRVDHPRNDHDDLANALFGLLYVLRHKQPHVVWATYNAGYASSNYVQRIGYSDGRVKLRWSDGREAWEGGRSTLYRASDGTLRLRSGDS
jgi:hypothetical protein